MPRVTNPRQKNELIKCIEDPWYWFTHYCRTFDKPRQRTALFPDWDYLHDYIRELQKGGKILVEKSRDMMITIATCGWMLYNVQFTPDWSGFVTSRREDEVDDGGDQATTDSIFGVILFGWKNQPIWMQSNLKFSHLKILNLEEGMNSYITGESTNPNSGRGKSVTFKWGDEFAFVPQSEKVHASMSGGAYRTLLYTSTSNLTGNAFHRLRSDPNSGFRVLTYRWDMRPDRTREWYEARKASLSPIDAAKELDIVYEISSPASVYPRYNYELHTAPRENLPFDGELIIGFDEGFAQPGAMYACLLVDGGLYIVDEFYEAGVHVKVDEERLAAGEKDWLSRARYLAMKYNKTPGQVTVAMGFESRSAEDIFASAGFRTYRATKDKLGRIKLVDQLMIPDKTGKPSLIIAQECVNLLWELPRYEHRISGGVMTEMPKDGNDHGCDAIAVVAEYAFGNHEEEPEWYSDVEDWEAAKEL